MRQFVPVGGKEADRSIEQPLDLALRRLLHRQRIGIACPVALSRRAHDLKEGAFDAARREMTEGFIYHLYMLSDYIGRVVICFTLIGELTSQFIVLRPFQGRRRTAARRSDALRSDARSRRR